jgi:para-aminobenzoate synthetase component 1
MRKTASFPARDLDSFKKKLIHWAGNFSVCTCFDFNSYKEFHRERNFIAAIGDEEVIRITDAVFPSLRNFIEAKKDWLFGFFSYDLKNEIESKVFSLADNRFDGIQFPLSFLFSSSTCN